MYRYQPKWLILSTSKIGLSKCWQNAVIFLMHPDNLRKKAQRSKSTVILQQRNQVRFHKRTDKINHWACVNCHSWKKNIIRKFHNARSYHIQVLCMNKLPLYFQTFSQHKKFDCISRSRSPIDAHWFSAD